MSRPESDKSPSASSGGLSLSQIAASAAAASSAAFAASYLGVAGTIIGAAVASVIATVATSMYAASLRHSRAAVRRTAGQFGATWVVTAPPARPVAPRPAAGESTTAGTRVLAPVVDIAPEPPREEAREGVRWTRVLATSAAVLALTLATLTGVEAVFGKPLSALFGGSDGTGTSLSTVTGGANPPERPEHRAPVEQTPTPEPSPAEEPTVEPTPTPTAEPSDQPTAEPTDEPTDEPGGTPTAVPTATPTP